MTNIDQINKAQKINIKEEEAHKINIEKKEMYIGKGEANLEVNQMTQTDLENIIKIQGIISQIIQEIINIKGIRGIEVAAQVNHGEKIIEIWMPKFNIIETDIEYINIIFN